MISPYVRKLRLATEMRRLRADSGLTADQLAKRIGRSRADISRLENGHVACGVPEVCMPCDLRRHGIMVIRVPAPALSHLRPALRLDGPA
jgi:transcriptional regulator with XRE-family HTH domain